MQGIEALQTGEIRVKPLQAHARDLDLYGRKSASSSDASEPVGAGHQQG